eukprot:TRINITY_DN21_c1_g1_i1.p3 TRINITY_DN21_c1_g1~~TRINITY_DN21_c1_g1_i1.p3  ORF type:complete len:204 (+),score=78.82 TRINITY_DN21_c1_g1_i1:1439-2050(+)
MTARVISVTVNAANNSGNTSSPSPAPASPSPAPASPTPTPFPWPSPPPKGTFKTEESANASIAIVKVVSQSKKSYMYDAGKQQLVLVAPNNGVMLLAANNTGNNTNYIEVAFKDGVKSVDEFNDLVDEIKVVAKKASTEVEDEPSEGGSPKKGLKTWQIVLIAGGGVVVLAVLAFIFSSRSKKHSLADDLHGPLLEDGAAHNA